MLSVLFVFKGMLELAMAFLLAQGILWALLLLLQPGRYLENPIYQLLQVVTKPLIGLSRKVSPKFVVQKHLGLYAFWMLCVMWLILVWYLPDLCRSYNLTIEQCKGG